MVAYSKAVAEKLTSANGTVIFAGLDPTLTYRAVASKAGMVADVARSDLGNEGAGLKRSVVFELKKLGSI